MIDPRTFTSLLHARDALRTVDVQIDDCRLALGEIGQQLMEARVARVQIETLLERTIAALRPATLTPQE